MPYINKETRGLLSFGKKVALPQSPGELNYMITTLIHKYLGQDKECYSKYNEVIGVLECAKLELYRRWLSRYEDEKINENGDLPYIDFI